MENPNTIDTLCAALEAMAARVTAVERRLGVRLALLERRMDAQGGK